MIITKSVYEKEFPDSVQMVISRDTNPAVLAVVEALKQQLTAERHAFVRVNVLRK